MSKAETHRRLVGSRGAALGRWLACAAAARLLVGCLPSDTRPTPGTLHITVQPSPAVTDGVVTGDGWHISFERFLVGFGGTSVFGQSWTSCIPYSDSYYLRLFDFSVPVQQKVADVYAVGDCDLSVIIQPPDSDTLLTEGVTASDLTFMRTPSSDAYGYVEGGIEVGFGARPSIHIRGRASRDAVTKRFEWSFGSIGGSGCSLALPGGEVAPINMIFHGEQIFRDPSSFEPDTPLVFDDLANADTDGDQIITVRELVAASSDSSFGPLTDRFVFLLEELIPLYKDPGLTLPPPDNPTLPPTLPDMTCAPR